MVRWLSAGSECQERAPVTSQQLGTSAGCFWVLWCVWGGSCTQMKVVVGVDLADVLKAEAPAATAPLTPSDLRD